MADSKHFSEQLKFDTRLLEYSISRGLLSKEEIEKHLKSLPDCSQNADFVRVDEMGNKLDSLDQKH